MGGSQQSRARAECSRSVPMDDFSAGNMKDTAERETRSVRRYQVQAGGTFRHVRRSTANRNGKRIRQKSLKNHRRAVIP